MKQLRFRKIIALLVLLALQVGNSAFASDDSKSNMLFKIGRSKDANEIYYEVRTTSNGQLDVKNPIEIYWIKFTKGAKEKPLTQIQKSLAYGLKFINVTPEKAEFQFVSYKKRTLWLQKCSRGNYKVYTNVDGKEVELERVFIQIDGGTFLLPKISRVELHAKIAEGTENVVEIISP